MLRLLLYITRTHTDIQLYRHVAGHADTHTHTDTHNEKSDYVQKNSNVEYYLFIFFQIYIMHHVHRNMYNASLDGMISLI